MAEAEITTLREALYKQAQSIQELTAELEEEREAAASGADEALSMILRLQEEKAMEKMEACQYKRIAEAKIEHAEDSLEVLKEAMFQKEIEVANLKFQVQSYRQKLFLFGINDLEDAEINLSNSSRLCRRHTFMGVTRCLGRVGRHIHLLSSCFENFNLETDVIYKDGSSFCAESSIWSETVECSQKLKEHWRKFDINKTVITCDPVEPQAENVGLLPTEIEERVISVSVPANNRPQQSISGSLCQGEKPTKNTSYSKKNYLKCMTKHESFSNSYLEGGSIGKTVHSTSVLDKFEIPRNSSANANEEPNKKDYWVAAVQVKKKAEVSYPLLQSNAISPVDTLTTKSARNIDKSRKHSIVKKRVRTSPGAIEQLKERVLQLENEQQIMKEEQSKRHNEQMNLLGQIHGQLNLVQPQRKVSKCSQLSRQDEILLVSLMEAILSFAL
ncbi:hypothetical protein HPP92_020607 [Vanilla planifolia]|uniref:GTD-binding domain-containing protein n=1 Tax=Vanilla planifolia TaxID=51239 RepID=A0A835Q8U3_VANPL|nr:hypothetical protein HPP92_020607 [Vanilla planifolia]